jgi:hypothetical protein
MGKAQLAAATNYPAHTVLSWPWIFPAQLIIHFTSNPRNDVRYCFHIRLSSMEVDNAGAKYVVPADYGVGDECLTSALQPIDKFTVERVEMKFNL